VKMSAGVSPELLLQKGRGKVQHSGARSLQEVVGQISDIRQGAERGNKFVLRISIGKQGKGGDAG